MTGEAVVVRGLRAGYRGLGAWAPLGGAVIVDGIDLKLLPEEVVGIVGGNGSGKSTLIRAIVDSKSRWDGAVVCGDEDLAPGRIAYVPQSSGSTLSPWSTVREEIALGLRAKGMDRRLWWSAAEKVVAEFGVPVPLDRNVQHLSGGQRVRVAALRALAVPQFQLCVFDEPFEGLDADSRYALVRIVREVASRGTPVLVTSHREEDLRTLGAKILAITAVPIRQLTPVTGSAPSGEARGSSLPINENDRADALGAAEQESDPTAHGSGFIAIVLGLVGMVVGVAIWSILARYVQKPGLLPAPAPVGRAMLALLTSMSLAPHFLATMARAVGGWFLANAFAVPVGVLLGANRRVYQAASPWLAIARAAPIFVLVAPTAGIFRQMPEAQRCFLIWFTLFMISLQSISVAAALAPQRRVDIARVMGAGYWFQLRHVVFHESIAGTFSALETTLPIAVIVTLVVESFLIPKFGLAIFLFNRMFDPDLSLLIAHILLPGVAAALGLAVLRRCGRAYRYDL